MILIFLIIIIIFIFYTLFSKDNFKESKLINKKQIKDDNLLIPDLRGLNKSKYMDYKLEYGGIEQFKNVKLDNLNLTNNIVNYKNYSSYRIKPYNLN
jgi:hypothetical protein